MPSIRPSSAVQRNQVTDFNTNLKQFLSLNFKQKLSEYRLRLQFSISTIFYCKNNLFCVKIVLRTLAIFLYVFLILANNLNLFSFLPSKASLKEVTGQVHGNIFANL